MHEHDDEQDRTGGGRPKTDRAPHHPPGADRAAGAGGPDALDAGGLLALQAMVGNAAAGRLIRPALQRQATHAMSGSAAGDPARAVTAGPNVPYTDEEVKATLRKLIPLEMNEMFDLPSGRVKESEFVPYSEVEAKLTKDQARAQLESSSFSRVLRLNNNFLPVAWSEPTILQGVEPVQFVFIGTLDDHPYQLIKATSTVPPGFHRVDFKESQGRQSSTEKGWSIGGKLSGGVGGVPVPPGSQPTGGAEISASYGEKQTETTSQGTELTEAFWPDKPSDSYSRYEAYANGGWYLGYSFARTADNEVLARPVRVLLDSQSVPGPMTWIERRTRLP